MRRAIIAENAPGPVGPYSQAVAVGNLIFVSGQIGIEPLSNALVEGIAAQTRQALKNVAAVLGAAGSGLEDVVRADVFVADMGDFAEANKIYAEYFSADPKPARVTCGVRELPKNALIEISCIAAAKDHQ